jgi:isopentenyl-diphosphate delta-isomerase
MTDQPPADDRRSTTRDERVVLVDDTGHAIGAALKAHVHHRATPLHLAFSCYVFDNERRLLVTQRAFNKHTFPGVWTNTVCGHPTPGEDVADAVVRRAQQELGIVIDGLRLVIPAFRYRAVMDNGVTENELCPVFVGSSITQPDVDHDEVAAVDWILWSTFASDVLEERRPVSHWCVEQVKTLVRLGPDPLAWSPRPCSELPPAALRPTETLTGTEDD